MKDTPICELMTTNVVSIPPYTSLLQAGKMMRDNRYSCLVVTEDEIPIGIITERDMVGIMVNFLEKDKHEHLLISDCMSDSIITIGKSTPVFEALVLVRSRRIRHIPVTDDNGKLTGIVTHSDLVKHKIKLLEDQETYVEDSVAKRTRELESSNEELRVMSLEDPLLKIGNRRSMEVDLQYTHEASMRYNRTYSVVLIDVDYFKKYNDHYGHQLGDKALQETATFINSRIRGSDRIYRYGGEELLLLLPETSANNATILIDRIVKGIAELNIKHTKSPYKRLTVSAGIADALYGRDKDTSWNVPVERADQALYSAKEDGRNRFALQELEEDETALNYGVAG